MEGTYVYNRDIDILFNFPEINSREHEHKVSAVEYFGIPDQTYNHTVTNDGRVYKTYGCPITAGNSKDIRQMSNILAGEELLYILPGDNFACIGRMESSEVIFNEDKIPVLRYTILVSGNLGGNHCWIPTDSNFNTYSGGVITSLGDNYHEGSAFLVADASWMWKDIVATREVLPPGDYCLFARITPYSSATIVYVDITNETDTTTILDSYIGTMAIEDTSIINFTIGDDDVDDTIRFKLTADDPSGAFYVDLIGLVRRPPTWT